MKHRIWKRSFIIMIAFVVFLMPLSAQADGTDGESAEETVIQSTPIGTAYITDNSYMELKDVMMLPGDEENTVSFKVTLHNGDAEDIQFIYYWVRLQSKSGVQYTVNLMPEDKDKNRIPSQTSQTFSYYAKVSASTRLSDLQFKLIRWDFTTSEYETEVAEMTVPDNYQFVVPVDAKKLVYLNDIPVKTHIKRTVVSKNDAYYLPTITMEMVNTGNSTVKLPDLQYAIRTQNGLVYPLTATGLAKDTAIQPLVDKEGSLTGAIPVTVPREGWQLVVLQSISGEENASASELPVAFFEMPDSELQDVSIGNEYEFATNDGTYTAVLNSLYRLPWEEQDILTADITIANRGGGVLPIPDFTGYFKLDDNVIIDARAIITDQVISLQPGEEINVHLSGKVPYTNRFSSIQLFLQQEQSSSGGSGSGDSGGDNAGAVDLIQFFHNSDLLQIPVIRLGSEHELKTIGKNSKFFVRSLDTYTGVNGEMVSVRLIVENLEKRFTDTADLVAHFRTEDGIMFPAEITDVKNKVSPGGEAVLYVSGIMPKGYETANLQLIIGEAANLPSSDSNSSGGSDSPQADAYVNAVAFQLPQEVKEVKEDFVNMDFYPYTLSMRRIGVTMLNFQQGNLKLEFDYELTKNGVIEANTDDHRIIIEFEDSVVSADERSNFKMSQEYILEKKADSESGGGGNDPTSNVLELGTKYAYFEGQDKDLVNKIETMDNYRLNVYYQIQPGQKKLIATRLLSWYGYSD